MAKSFNISDPFISTFRTRGKAIAGDSLPEFKLTGSWRPNKHGDEGYGTWANTGVGFTIASKDKQFEQKQFHNLKQRAKNDKGIQTTTGWINKDTLSKGVNTILGMSEQRDEDGYLTQGKNYANPYYPQKQDPLSKAISQSKLKNPEAFENAGAWADVDQDFQFNAGHYSGVQSSKKQQFENQKQKVKTIMDARKSNTISTLPPALRGGAVEQNIKNTQQGITTAQSTMSSQVNKRNIKRRANRWDNYQYMVRHNPTINFANTLQIRKK